MTKAVEELQSLVPALVVLSVCGKWSTSVSNFVHLMFSHISGNKIGWEKTGSHSEPQARGDPGDQTKVAEGSSTASSGSQLAEGKGSQIGTVQPIPCLLSMPTRNHMDITTPPLPPVAPEVLRVAEHRHKKGLMYPYIFHVLTKGEIKIAVSIEDEASKDLPPAALLYRPVRQYVYGVLFSLAESRKKTERLAFRKNRLPPECLRRLRWGVNGSPLLFLPVVSPVIIKEWAAYKGKSPQTPELVEALAFREWTCPNLKRLWLGKAVEDKNRRMRAFLACMRSDTPAMLNPASVPTHLTVLCCVLRYMVQWPGARILRRQELDAFLAQALSPKLYEPDQLQELKIENLDPRGIQLSALFMSGVDMALFANDACGQPVPWEHCCPWMYFDGKLFQSKLLKASREKTPLIDLCDGQAEQAAKVEKMRQSILEGLNFSRQSHPLPFPPPAALPFYPASVYPRHFGPIPPAQGRGRGFAGERAPPLRVGTRRRPRGVISTPVIRTFGRGGRYYGRGYKNQGAIQGVTIPRFQDEQAAAHVACSRRPRGNHCVTSAALLQVCVYECHQAPAGVPSLPLLNQKLPYRLPVFPFEQGKPPYAASAEEVAKELKSRSGESKSSAVSSDGSLAENGAVAEEKPAPQMNGSAGDARAPSHSESALNNDSKTCNTNPHLNALSTDSACRRADALEAAVLKKEE
ncbi:Constitutive coactivator of PPAR-gamma-like protein 1 [Camelus dromedarius]|uniref:Constitutive coactivator of PPAR-gamma-like protein 1 n=1 Tax=Camelus dromedarius TaxID=9838 RepID=A0A5N4C056_CAMDR|nr:Constitutive coactivator of PPAR-gamma-like protein 1 [Camelus dromedarius]